MEKSKIALVTGGSRGLGKEMALRLADHSHDVIFTYHSQKEAADEVVRSIQAKGQKAAALILNTDDIASLTEFVNQFQQVLKTLNTSTFDFLINNAGIGATIPFAEVTEEVFDKFVNIHFKSVYFLTQKL